MPAETTFMFNLFRYFIQTQDILFSRCVGKTTAHVRISKWSINKLIRITEVTVVDLKNQDSQPVASEAVSQVGRLPYQSEIWYGGRHTIRMKFGQLILRKIIKIVATRMSDLRPKYTEIDFGWGLRRSP